MIYILDTGDCGYTPNKGVDIAAFNPKALFDHGRCYCMANLLDMVFWSSIIDPNNEHLPSIMYRSFMGLPLVISDTSRIFFNPMDVS